MVNINSMVLASIIRGYRLDVEMHLNIVSFLLYLALKNSRIRSIGLYICYKMGLGRVMP